MKKVGRKVHFMAPEGAIRRIGEGSFIRLKNNSILFAFTEFLGGREDEDIARISVISSTDEGESWSDGKVLFEKGENDVNIMSLSFLRMNNGDIGAFYIVKNADGSDTIVMRRSSDGGESWSEPMDCLSSLERPDYFILNNDRPLKLKNGRIILPLARHTIYDNEQELSVGELLFFFSDDDGYTWEKTEQELKTPFPNDKIGFQEPGLYELADGRIWCYIRTLLGYQYESYSEDNGETWSTPEPNVFFSSPASPMSVKPFKDLTVAIFNPVPEHILRNDDAEFWGRTPYVMAVMKKEENQFTQEKLFYIEDDLNNGYCYPATLEGEDFLLVAYYHSNNTDCCLNSTKIIKIMYDELN